MVIENILKIIGAESLKILTSKYSNRIGLLFSRESLSDMRVSVKIQDSSPKGIIFSISTFLLNLADL